MVVNLLDILIRETSTPMGYLMPNFFCLRLYFMCINILVEIICTNCFSRRDSFLIMGVPVV